jgi:glycosyltransferase involved in cell wall biosynthesis
LNSSLRKNNVCAVIPFYNEERTIREIIEKTLNYVDLIICIDDGSTDTSLSIIPKKNNVIVLKNDVNRGKGFSLKRGFEKSLELKTNYTVVLDADLQHPPEYIPDFIEKLNSSDLIIGNRLNNLSKMPIQRILSNTITSKLLSIKTKKKILDSQCGFRGFRTEILMLILPAFNGYEAESEMLVKAANNNLRIDFISIPTIYGSEKSKMQPFQTIKGFIKVLLT